MFSKFHPNHLSNGFSFCTESAFFPHMMMMKMTRVHSLSPAYADHPISTQRYANHLKCLLYTETPDEGSDLLRLEMSPHSGLWSLRSDPLGGMGSLPCNRQHLHLQLFAFLWQCRVPQFLFFTDFKATEAPPDDHCSHTGAGCLQRGRTKMCLKSNGSQTVLSPNIESGKSCYLI